MTDTTRSIERPKPRPTELSTPFWDAAKRRELQIQRCTSCGKHVFYPRYSCPHCGARELNWVRASGRATVYSYTVARRPTHAAFAARVPYVIAIVELEEGPRMMGNVTGVDPDDMQIGTPVEIYFVQADEGVAVPLWRLSRT